MNASHFAQHLRLLGTELTVSIDADGVADIIAIGRPLDLWGQRELARHRSEITRALLEKARRRQEQEDLAVGPLANLSPVDLSLGAECRLHWLENPASFPYVRQVFVDGRTREGQPPAPYDRGLAHQGARVVGWAVLHPMTPSREEGRFLRRVFWVLGHDRTINPHEFSTYDPCSAPMEAVDPATLAPGEIGSLTERAWGAPLK